MSTKINVMEEHFCTKIQCQSAGLNVGYFQKNVFSGQPTLIIIKSCVPLHQAGKFSDMASIVYMEFDWTYVQYIREIYISEKPIFLNVWRSKYTPAALRFFSPTTKNISLRSNHFLKKLRQKLLILTEHLYSLSYINATHGIESVDILYHLEKSL